MIIHFKCSRYLSKSTNPNSFARAAGVLLNLSLASVLAPASTSSLQASSDPTWDNNNVK